VTLGQSPNPRTISRHFAEDALWGWLKIYHDLALAIPRFHPDIRDLYRSGQAEAFARRVRAVADQALALFSPSYAIGGCLRALLSTWVAISLSTVVKRAPGAFPFRIRGGGTVSKGSLVFLSSGSSKNRLYEALIARHGAF
jgi:hypothetical protein